MNGFTRSKKPTERDLAALADGSLSGARRTRVERAVAGSPELRADLADQRLALHTISQAAGERAPGSLRAAVELARNPRDRHRARRPAWASAVVAVGALAAAAVLVLAGGPTSAPTVASAATLANRTPTMPAGRDNSTTLAWPYAAGAGLPFPDWARKFGFTAVGWRRDRLDGHLATTVFYARSGSLIGYTIVSGRPLLIGARSRESAWDGTRLWSFGEQGRAVVTWLRDGHTCVLSGSPALLSELQRLAAWKVYGG
jgi:anti-sigma factor RsiW